MPSSKPNYKILLQESFVGVKTGLGHAMWFIKHVMGDIETTLSKPFHFFTNSIGQPSRTSASGSRNHLAKTNSKERASSSSSEESDSNLQVIGVGFGRTGTYSLKMALDRLGYPTLHTQHLYEIPEILDMWIERVFKPAIDRQELYMGDPDWNLITSYGYKATVDFPSALYYEQLNQLYPDAKFILTTRENSEVWFESFQTMATSVAQITSVGGGFLRHVNQLATYLRWLSAQVNKDKELLSSRTPLPNLNKERAMNTYLEHNRRVREIIPSERLLEYKIEHGWKPLCDFLDIHEAHCPKDAFPKTNSATSVKAQATSSSIIVISGCVFIVYIVFGKLLPWIIPSCRKTRLGFPLICRSSRLLSKKSF